MPLRSGAGFNINQPMTIIVMGVLLLLAGFTITRFLLNFDQLQRLAEESSNTTAVEALPSTEASGAEAIVSSGAASIPVSAQSTEVSAWLVPLNRYRAMMGLTPVSADAQLSRGDFLHSHYLAVNYASQLPDLRLGAEVHTEDPAKPEFTAEGAAAAQASDIDWTWGSHSRPKPSWAIDNWMQAPFHRMQIINPYLRRVGYGTDCRGPVCFAALNTGTDVDPPPAMPSPWPKPLVFPVDGSVTRVGTFSDEWPDPLTACRGYTAPAGVPITLELGRLIQPRFSDYSVKGADSDSTSIEACAFDADTYVNSDPAAQSAARTILSHFGAIVIVPRRPLSPGRYVIALTAGQRYTWSFSIAGRDSE
ncbi:MAG: hypothetical protein JO189_29015 [Deltaproteobacteria bacterium]|nr:hypothetical protein [Deltaproteobacteria bacterium]